MRLSWAKDQDLRFDDPTSLSERVNIKDCLEPFGSANLGWGHRNESRRRISMSVVCRIWLATHGSSLDPPLSRAHPRPSQGSWG